jgi:hypothetical protein
VSGKVESDGLPPEIQGLLRQYMPVFVGENAVVLGGDEHMRLIFVGTPNEDGKPNPRCAIDLSYEVANGLVTSIREVLARRPS